jgi:hypothetical protein
MKLVGIFTRLAKADPGNLGTQRDLATAYEALVVRTTRPTATSGSSSGPESLLVMRRTAVPWPPSAGT